ncbi:MAG: multisubunit potassium/proton antiporter, PhaG subunit [Polaromonas sp.]|nr:multisubunit potassium/proton antiporter, PhaG subunit [Polaromonas sp.]
MMPEVDLPAWAELVVAALVLAGAALALLGSVGLLRLPTFFERVHAPALIATGGCWCVTLGTVIFFSLQRGEVAVFPLLIAVFIAITVPISTVFLMRAGLFRARQQGQAVPPSVSHSVSPGGQDS